MIIPSSPVGSGALAVDRHTDVSDCVGAGPDGTGSRGVIPPADIEGLEQIGDGIVLEAGKDLVGWVLHPCGIDQLHQHARLGDASRARTRSAHVLGRKSAYVIVRLTRR